LILMGLGDKGQIGLNSAPADFAAAASYTKVEKQQEDTLITMTVRGMLRSGHIIVCAPYDIHARNVWQLMISPLTENFPASALKRHPQFTLLLDRASAQYVSPAMAARYTPELTEFEVIGDADWVR
jgi:glucosamine-6-phosphate deaminase